MQSLPPSCQQPSITESVYHQELDTIRQRIESNRKMRRRTEVCVEMMDTATTAVGGQDEDWTRVEGNTHLMNAQLNYFLATFMH